MAVLANLLQVETFPLHTTFTAVAFFNSFALSVSLCCVEYVYIYLCTHIWLRTGCIWITVENK